VTKIVTWLALACSLKFAAEPWVILLENRRKTPSCYAPKLVENLLLDGFCKINVKSQSLPRSLRELGNFSFLEPAAQFHEKLILEIIFRFVRAFLQCLYREILIIKIYFIIINKLELFSACNLISAQIK